MTFFPIRFQEGRRGLVNKQVVTNSKQQGQRVLDLGISAALIAERMIGEILSWDLVDWSTIERHRGKKFSFERRRGEVSIHDQLKPLFDRCDHGQGDFATLRPSPIVNANLSKLVGYLCQHIGKSNLPSNAIDAPALNRSKEQDQLHLAVVQRIVGRIEEDPHLRERAWRLKHIAAAAESELESHFADLINERLEGSFLPKGNLEAHKIRGLQDQAKSRLPETKARNEHELLGLAMPDLALDEDSWVRIEMSKILLSRFPYVRNYELMLLAELTMLQQPMIPRFVPERRIADQVGGVDLGQIERLDDLIHRLAHRVEPLRMPARPSSPSNQTFAICGSGPLPMTALFLHLFTGARIVLVDNAQTAIERSKRLIDNLERLEILSPGDLTVVPKDAGELRFHKIKPSVDASPDATLSCDAVIIASLVDRETKASIASQFSADPAAPPLLIMRSATGLSAKLAYDAVPTETFSRGLLAYCGETLPAPQVATHQSRSEAARQGNAHVASPDVLAIAHPDVVNTTEVYRSMPAFGESGALDFGTCVSLDDWLKALERVCSTSG